MLQKLASLVLVALLVNCNARSAPNSGSSNNGNNTQSTDSTNSNDTTGNGNTVATDSNGTTITHPAGTRLFNFVNLCTYPVSFAFAGGATSSPTCTSDANCPVGASCIAAGPNHLCFWDNPAPSNGNYLLAPQGGTNYVIVPASPGSGAQWSGVISGRLECSAGTCAIADCGDNGSGGCVPSRGFAQPATQAEFTLSSAGTDFYDVEIINGISVPMSMAPVHSVGVQAVMDPNKPYFCGSPGAATPSSSLLGGCSWTFTPPSNDYVWVTRGGITCNTTADCGSGTVCGLSFTPGVATPLAKTCGTQNGWWSADEVCGLQTSYGAPFYCSSYSNLYACVSVGSCYQPGANNTCCGCENWDSVGLHVPPSPYTNQCVSTNPTWTSHVEPTLQWMKEGCPTAYTYPFDDMSSTFTCSNVQNGNNAVDYTVTFCPHT